jgi:hypothetical protein
MLCSDKIAAVARKLELTDVVDLHNNDRGKFQKYLSESISLDEKIVKAFKRQIKYEIDKRLVNPDALSFERRYELERIRNCFIDDLGPEFLWVCRAEHLVTSSHEKTASGE